MKTRITIALTSFLCAISVFPIIVCGISSNELSAFVNEAVTQLNKSSLQIPQFKQAEIDVIEPVESAKKIANTNLYLCWLKNNQGRVGYMAVASTGGTFQIVAFSATTVPPDYFLKNLQIGNPPKRQLNLSNAKQISFVENVPLVASAKTVIGTEPIEISEIACSLSSLLNYIQNEQKILLFGHLGHISDPEYTRRFKENPASRQYPDDPNWLSFDKEARQSIEKENIPKGLSSGEKTDSRNKQRNLIKPIIRRRLLNPVNARERLDLIQNEASAIEHVTRIDISSGMKDAIMLQLDYLDGNITSLVKNIEVFFETRGRTSQIDIMPFEKLQKESLPAILIGPDNIASVVLGFMDIDGEKFALIFFPKTGKPYKITLTDRMREINKEGKALADPNEAVTEEGREMLSRLRDMQNKTIITENIPSKFPESMNTGVHIFNISNISAWQILTLSEISIDKNW